LEEFDPQGREGLAPQQAVAAEGSGAEKPEHGIPAVKSGRDGLGGERGRDHAQGKHPGDGEVDAPALAERGEACQGEAEQRAEGQDERDEELFAVGEQAAQLEQRLGANASRRWGGGAHDVAFLVRPK
jgi:hypothetical protein